MYRRVGAHDDDILVKTSFFFLVGAEEPLSSSSRSSEDDDDGESKAVVLLVVDATGGVVGRCLEGTNARRPSFQSSKVGTHYTPPHHLVSLQYLKEEEGILLL
jgi:hypothetical protein